MGVKGEPEVTGYTHSKGAWVDALVSEHRVHIRFISVRLREVLKRHHYATSRHVFVSNVVVIVTAQTVHL